MERIVGGEAIASCLVNHQLKAVKMLDESCFAKQHEEWQKEERWDGAYSVREFLFSSRQHNGDGAFTSWIVERSLQNELPRKQPRNNASANLASVNVCSARDVGGPLARSFA